MGYLSSFFGKHRVAKAAAAAGAARGQQLQGQEVGQTSCEQQATRRRIEAEPDAQRHEREQTTRSDA